MCDKCRDYNGQWQMTDRGLIRCDCPGNDAVRKLADAAEHPRYNRPTISAAQASAFVEALAVIPYFPGEVGARTAIGDEIRALCAGVVEAGWLVTRMRRLYSRWPGTLDMRHVYASKHVPWDGLLPIGTCEAYPDGIPSEVEQRAKGLPAAPMKALPPARVASIDAGADSAIRLLAASKDFTKRPAIRARTPEVPVNPDVRPITQADIDAAVEANRDARARAEIGGAA